MKSYQSLEKFNIAGRGLMITVLNDEECYDFNHLCDKDVLIDGDIYFCLGVEYYAIPVCRIGKVIGLNVVKK